MDSSKAGYLLIGSTMVILAGFLIALLLLMIIYRRRKLEHLREIQVLNEKYRREMLETQVDIQKDTMQQIGQDIHDNVGQKLTLASLYSVQLELPQENENKTEKISSIRDLINESLDDLRHLSRSLTRSAEDGTDLDALLRKEVTNMNKAGICVVSFESVGQPIALSIKVSNMILRIAQEFLSNSARHAVCKNIYVSTRYDLAGLTVRLADDGKGFSLTDATAKPGIGLINMKKRASLIEATLSLKTAPGEGTMLELFLPKENNV